MVKEFFFWDQSLEEEREVPLGFEHESETINL